MELEEAIKRIEELKKYICYDSDEGFANQEAMLDLEAIDTVIKYIKEESILRAVVEEKIKKINELLLDIDYHDIKDKQEREYYKKEYMKYITARNFLQGLLNKGE